MEEEEDSVGVDARFVLATGLGFGLMDLKEVVEGDLVLMVSPECLGEPELLRMPPKPDGTLPGDDEQASAALERDERGGDELTGMDMGAEPDEAGGLDGEDGVAVVTAAAAAAAAVRWTLDEEDVERRAFLFLEHVQRSLSM